MLPLHPTGEHVESQADTNILKDPKLRFIGLVLLVCLGAFVHNVFRFQELHNPDKGGVTMDKKAAPVPAGQTQKPTVPDSDKVPSADTRRAAGDVSIEPVHQSSGFFDSLGYRLVQVSHHDTADTDHQRLSFLADSKDGLKHVDFRDLFFAGVRVSVHGLCNIKLIAPDGSILSLGCSSDVVRNCSASVNSATLAIRRNCAKYGEPKPKMFIPQNALVAAATGLTHIVSP